MRSIQTLLLLLVAAVMLGGGNVAPDDVTDVPSERCTIQGDANRAYFLISQAAAECSSKGCALLVVLPGGDGGASFLPFIKSMRTRALSADFVVAQPIAVKWSPEQECVWPSAKRIVPQQKFTTEQFVLDVIEDVRKQRSIDPGRIYCMGWSSSGPAVYTLALQDKTPITGFYVSMSVYKPAELPPVANAKGRSIYIEHAPDDQTCPYPMAEQANVDLSAAGARTTLVSYLGGHGWTGLYMDRIAAGLRWLEERF